MTIKILRYKPWQQGPVVGFLDIEIPGWHMQIKGLNIVQKEGKRFFNLPSKEFKNDQGETKYASIVKFTDEEVQRRFSNAIGKAFDEYCLAQQQGQTQETEDPPF